jgi:hypothetical protein
MPFAHSSQVALVHSLSGCDHGSFSTCTPCAGTVKLSGSTSEPSSIVTVATWSLALATATANAYCAETRLPVTVG